MTKKRFMMTMDPKIHSVLKDLSGSYGVIPGDFIEILLKSLGMRMKRAYEIAHINKRTSDIDKEIIQLLMSCDRNGWAESVLSDMLIELGNDQNDWEWTSFLDVEIKEELLEKNISKAYEIVGITERDKDLDKYFENLVRLGLDEGGLDSKGMHNEFRAAVKEWQIWKKDQAAKKRE